jgi:hypothetical protein
MVDTILDNSIYSRIYWSNTDLFQNPIQKGIALVICKQINIAYQKIVWGIIDINLQLVMHVNRIVIISGFRWGRTPVLLYTGLL